MKKVQATPAFELLAGFILMLLVVNISGCGAVGSSPSTPSGNVSIAFTQAPPTTLAASGTAVISATVANDSTNAGVDWSCAPVGTCGTFNPAHTASGATTTYTAPSAAATVTITATSTNTHTATAVATVAVTGGTNNTVSISITTAPPSTLQVNGTATIAATVTNDTANAGVDWTCTPISTCGAFNPAHTASGANTSYTAPAAAVAAVVITATATSSKTATASANVSVTATTTTGSIPAGTYSFYVNGEDSKKNTYAIAGAVVLDATGKVTAGEQDYASVGGAASPEPGGDTITGGTLTIAGNNLGTLTLITNNSAVGVSGTETFSFSKVNSKHAVIGEFDAGATSSGSFDLSTVSSTTFAALNGPFVFEVSGKNGSNQEAFGGLFTADGAGNLSIADFDYNIGGTVSRGHTNTTTYAAPDAAGRGTFAFGGTNYVYYMVTAKVLRIIVTSAGEPDIGSAYAGVAGITNASLGTTFVFTDSSNLSTGASYAAAGKLTLDGNGNVASGFADVDENNTVTSAAVTGTYTVDANGYGTITLTPGATQDISVLGLYLADSTINPTDPNSPADAGLSGLLLDLDTKVVGSGWLILPAAGTPTLAGSFSTDSQSSASNNELDSVGIATVSGTAFTGTANYGDLLNTGLGTGISESGTLVPDATNAGRSTMSLLVSLPANPPTLKYVIYQASSTQLFTIEVDTNQFASGTLQKQQ